MQIFEVRLVEYARRDRLWRTFYHNYDQFKSHYDACVNRMMHAERHGVADPRNYQPTFTTPQPYPELEPSDETKSEVKVRDNHRCCCCGNGNARLLEIDHVTPKYLHADHQRENLQTLCRICHQQKGRDEGVDFRNHRTTLTAAPNGFPNGPLPSGRDAKDPGQWEMYLRRCVNFYYRCAAVEGVDIAARGERFRTWPYLAVPGQRSGLARAPSAAHLSHASGRRGRERDSSRRRRRS